MLTIQKYFYFNSTSLFLIKFNPTGWPSGTKYASQLSRPVTRNFTNILHITVHSGLHFNSYRAHTLKTYVKFIKRLRDSSISYYNVAWDGYQENHKAWRETGDWNTVYQVTCYSNCGGSILLAHYVPRSPLLVGCFPVWNFSMAGEDRLSTQSWHIRSSFHVTRAIRNLCNDWGLHSLSCLINPP